MHSCVQFYVYLFTWRTLERRRASEGSGSGRVPLSPQGLGSETEPDGALSLGHPNSAAGPVGSAPNTSDSRELLPTPTVTYPRSLPHLLPSCM